MRRDGTLTAPKALIRSWQLRSPRPRGQNCQGGKSKLDLNLPAAPYRSLTWSLYLLPPRLTEVCHHLSCPAHSPDTGSQVPVSNVGVIATGQERERGLILEVQHPSPWGEVTAQVCHQLPTGEREGQRMSHYPTLAHTDSLNLQMASVPQEMQLSFLS